MTLGRCSLCSGTVSVPDVWFGVTPPRATCEGCGAVACEGEAVIEMVGPAYGTASDWDGAPGEAER